MGRNIKLTENDTRGTLSSVKKAKPPKTVIVKNITEYWPVLSEEKVTKFLEILEHFLSIAINKQYVSIGLDSTLRHLKSNPQSTSLLAIADEISPKWFGKHLISTALARNTSIKIIILPKMKDHTKKLLNVPTIVWSMKESACLDDFYKELDIHKELLRNYYSIQPNRDVSIKRKRKRAIQQEEPTVVHLTKSSSPAFVPNREEEASTLRFDGGSDFISLSNFDDPDLVSKSSPMPAYRLLKVNKIVGNLLRKGK